ncbi:MAG: Excinuclease ABC subunit C [Erysipelotrichaceae bacterium]|nr:MAG: Excinuclease ABC subunit [Erysipelotrichaceae bacterium]TXT16656.1 MAG: Excinuclease ABC subunit C [Erysipelotrichaceae bacterium]
MNLKDKLNTMPQGPGIYIMKDLKGTIIYVGKAKKLKNRVNQYFVGAHDYKTTKLVSRIVDFDYIITRTEKEALILEINLIKQHRPRFNIMFMDDKSYPYLKITQEKYPRLRVVRDLKKDKKATYFGPYPDATAAHQMRKLLNDLYPLRQCEIMPKKVCLYYHLGQCLGPCQFDINPELYKEMVAEITDALRGNNKVLKNKLLAEMNAATEKQLYEKAAQYRDYLKFLDYVKDPQSVTKDDQRDTDAFAYYEDKGYIAIQGLLLRQGMILDRKFVLQELHQEAQEAFIEFILQYYSEQPKPSILLLPFGVDISWLKEMDEYKIHQPQKGKQKSLMNIVTANAKQHLEQNIELMARKHADHERALIQLAELLKLDDVERIELYDNSHISGSFASGACVVYEHGLPSKKDYRLYDVHSQADDLKNMEEVIYRRYYRIIKEKGRLPSLILVDGGQLQINAVKKTLESIDVHVPVAGLRKNEKHATAELLDENGETIDLREHKALFFLLNRMQDEVHRFVITHHKKRRAKGQVASILDEVEGLGPIRLKQLSKMYKNVNAMKEASLEDLEKVLPKSVALSLFNVLKQ